MRKMGADVGISEKRGIVTELHKPARRNFVRLKTYVKAIDDLWQIDLADVQSYSKKNRGNKYILVVIDVLSKYVWAAPVRDKRGISVTNAMREILAGKYQQNLKGELIQRIPANIQCDAGKEFYNKHFRKLMDEFDINMYSTYSIKKAAVCERVIRTLKNWLYLEFSVNGNYKWLDILPAIVEKYNNRKHRTTGMPPVKVAKRHEPRLLKILNKHPTIRRKSKFKINDVVRISKHRTVFAKGYTPSWTTELFTISKVRNTVPPSYLLKDSNLTDISGFFYEPELQATKYPDIYLVEKVLRRDKNGIYVKFLGMGNEHNSYIEK